MDPPLILLVAAAVELALFRIASREMQGEASAYEQPVPAPAWVVYLGLFAFYFASALGVGVLLHKLIEVLRDRHPYRIPVAMVAAVACLAFLALGTTVVLTRPTQSMSFLVETSFAAALMVLLAAQLTVRGDLGARIGMVLLSMPLLLHYTGQFYLYYVGGEEAIFSGFDLRIERIGLWSLIFAALLTPYCFAPRPFVDNASRLMPLVAGTGAGLLCALFIRLDQERAAEWTLWATGIDIGERTPLAMLGLYLLALSAISWTLVACLTAPSRARRQIGVGLGLIVLSGYAFSWPLQYLLSLTGLFTIGQATVRARVEERRLAGHRPLRGPVIDDVVWSRYVTSVVDALRQNDGNSEEEGDYDENSPGSGRTATVTVKGDDNLARTYVVSRRHGVPIKVRIERQETPEELGGGGSSLLTVEVQCGEAPPDQGEPAWTLCPRPNPSDGSLVHPEPPPTSAPMFDGDGEFESRFRVRDRGGFTDKLFDAGLRSSAAKQVFGWMAYWPEHAIAYQVYPGVGAPLDRPIPVTDLAFRGSAAQTDGLVQLVEFLAEVSARAGLGTAPSTTPIGSSVDAATAEEDGDSPGEPAVTD